LGSFHAVHLVTFGSGSAVVGLLGSCCHFGGDFDAALDNLVRFRKRGIDVAVGDLLVEAHVRPE